MIIDMTRGRRDLAHIAELLDGGRMPVPALTIYPLERARDALFAMKNGGVKGKIVVSMPATIEAQSQR